jgi:hypothetical protein
MFFTLHIHSWITDNNEIDQMTDEKIGKLWWIAFVVCMIIDIILLICKWV